MSEKIRNSSDFKAVVTLGTGGSELGPSMVVKALAGFHDGPMIHFVGNADPQSLYDVLKLCDPKSTLFVVVSKSF